MGDDETINEMQADLADEDAASLADDEDVGIHPLEEPKPGPMAPVAVALRDALTVLGWDASQDIIASSLPYGRIEIHLLPNTYQVVPGGGLAKVTASAYLDGLVHAWSRAVPPPMRHLRLVSETSGVHVVDESGADADVSRAEWRRRFRTPLPYEASGE